MGDKNLPIIFTIFVMHPPQLVLFLIFETVCHSISHQSLTEPKTFLVTLNKDCHRGLPPITNFIYFDDLFTTEIIVFT